MATRREWAGTQYLIGKLAASFRFNLVGRWTCLWELFLVWPVWKDDRLEEVNTAALLMLSWEIHFFLFFWLNQLFFLLITGPLSEQERWIGSLLLRHIQLLQFNAHEVSELQMERPGCMDRAKTLFLGAAVYPTVRCYNKSTLWDHPVLTMKRMMSRPNRRLLGFPWQLCIQGENRERKQNHSITRLPPTNEISMTHYLEPNPIWFITSTLYTFFQVSLFNHSCEPSVVRYVPSNYLRFLRDRIIIPVTYRQVLHGSSDGG